MEFDPKKVAEWLREPSEEEEYEEGCKEQERMAHLTEEEWAKEVEEMFAEELTGDAFEDQAARSAYCEQNGHTFRDEGWAGPESGGMAGTCRVCGYSFSTTLY